MMILDSGLLFGPPCIYIYTVSQKSAELIFCSGPVKRWNDFNENW